MQKIFVKSLKKIRNTNYHSPASAEERAAIAVLARHLLDVRGAGESVPALDEQLNRRVYGLFGAGKDEREIIEKH